MRNVLVLLSTALLIAGGAGETRSEPAPGVAAWPADAPAYADSMASWRAAREARLRSDTGWLTICGIFWLETGENAVGAAPGSAVLLPEDAAPPRAGTFRLRGEGGTATVTWVPEPGVEVLLGDAPAVEHALRTGESDEPEEFRLGRLTFWVLPRGERYAVRLRDPECALRKEFAGIDAYPVDPAYRVVATLEPFPPGTRIEVPNMLGHVDSVASPGTFAFTLPAGTHRLAPMAEGDSTLFFVFADATTGVETYGGGRFLYALLRADGTAVLDFNAAYNPPCAFNPYTTCPLPPAGNTLPVPVRAGETYDTH